METMFENLDFWYDKEDLDDDRPFMVACRDREVKNEDRWVLASLSEDEARKLRDFLNQNLKDVEP